MAEGRTALSAQLATINERLQASEESKIKTVAEFQNRLTAEKAFRAVLLSVADTYRRGISLRRYTTNVAQMREVAGVAKYMRETDTAFTRAEGVIAELDEYLRKEDEGIAGRLTEAANALVAELDEIEDAHGSIGERMLDYVSKLRGQGLAGSIAEFNELSQRKSALVAKVSRIDAHNEQLQEITRRFDEAIAALTATRAHIIDRRKAQIGRLNEAFGSRIGQYRVRITVDLSGMYDRYKSFIDENMHGSMFRMAGMEELCAATTPLDLADLLETKNLEALASLPGVGSRWASELVERIGTPTVTLMLRTIWKPYLPTIRVWETSWKRYVKNDPVTGF